MTVTDYLKRKNVIINNYTGVILVPAAQMQEVEQLPLSMDSDGETCPYCRVYAASFCNGCPMKEAGNSCGSEGSTYIQVMDRLHNKSITTYAGIRAPLFELVRQYNKELAECKFNEPILGQEAICPDGLGRVIDYRGAFPNQWIRVSTYVNDRGCKWAPHNVELINPR